MKTSLGLLLHVITLWWVLFCQSCASEDAQPADCSQSDLQIVLATKSNPTGCSAPDGSITVTGTGGNQPYQFKLDNGAFQSSPSFSNLSGGIFQVTIQDNTGCEKTLSITLESPGNIVISSVQVVNSTCGGSSGSLTITASGSPALSYRINNGAFQTSNLFANLGPGTYNIVVADGGSACTSSTSRMVLSDASYLNGVRPILVSGCGLSDNACHSSASGRDMNSYNSVRLRAGQIKNRINLPVDNPSFMPRGGPKLPQAEINLINCWVDDGAPNN